MFPKFVIQWKWARKYLESNNLESIKISVAIYTHTSSEKACRGHRAEHKLCFLVLETHKTRNSVSVEP